MTNEDRDDSQNDRGNALAFWHRWLGGDKTEDSLDQIKQNLNEGKAVMLDVRGQRERDGLHLKDSIFIPFNEVRALAPETTEIPGLPKDKIIYCH